MKNIFQLIIYLIFSYTYIFAQEEQLLCLASPISTASPYGHILPSIGTVNVLMVFAQFSDDNYDINNNTWVKGQSPASMANWIHQVWTNSPTQGSLTHYFNDMSFDQFKFTGKTVSATAPHSRQWYLDNNKKRWDIHKEILQQLDATWDFAEFDNWDSNKNNTPDEKVDMIIFVWRNIGREFDQATRTAIEIALDFGHDYGSLGFNYANDYFTVDDGSRRIYANDWGSGVTIRDLVAWGYQWRFRTVVHEVAHYLLGHNDYHNGFGFWGMLSSYGVKSIVANSFERNRLGWIVSPIIPANNSLTYSDIELGDYISTGQSRILDINSLNGENFYIEYHQSTSYWETTFAFGNIEPGVYVLRKDAIEPGDGSVNFKLISADGRFTWTVNQQTNNIWGSGTLPVFQNLNADRVNGYLDVEFVPWIWNSVPQVPAAIHFTENSSGQPVVDVKYAGDNNDAFRLGYNEVLSPWSNPNSQRANKNTTPFGLTLKNIVSGICTLDIHVNTAINTSPSKPQDMDRYNIHFRKLLSQSNLGCKY